MSKKKHKNKEQESISILKSIDETLVDTYDSIVDEIEYYQREIAIADAEAEKKARKALKKGKNVIYDGKSIKRESRIKIINEMDDRGFLDKVKDSLEDCGKIVVIIARLVASLILAILSFEPIKALIPPAMMRKIDSVYRMAMSIG